MLLAVEAVDGIVEVLVVTAEFEDVIEKSRP